MKYRVQKFLSVAMYLFVAISNSTFADEIGGVTALHPTATASGSQIAFAANYDGPMVLWIVNLNGSNLHKVPNTPAGTIQDPQWSPDGNWIAFSVKNGGLSDIWIISPGGDTLRRLTTNALHNRQPAWSPDSTKVAFISDRGGTNDIWLENIDGSGLFRVTTLPGQENDPSFSPSGSQLVFSETVKNSASLMIVNTDGSGLTPVTTGGLFQDWCPNWSSHGIVFASNRDTSSEHWKVWRIQPDGTGLIKLGDSIGLNPVWLTDGNVIFSDGGAATRSTSDISLLNTSTGTSSLITTVDGFHVDIKIRPDSRRTWINTRSDGSVPVAILSMANFAPVTDVDRSSLTFGHIGSEPSLKRCSKRTKDLNGDGVPDLICRFYVRATHFAKGDTVGILRFQTSVGTGFEGNSPIYIVSDPDDDDDIDRGDDKN